MNQTLKKIKVLIIDDSSVIRNIVKDALSDDEQIEVVGEAEDPMVARELIKKLNPDILTLDVEMPKMDGITFLENLMRLRPMPVVMLSTLTKQGADVTLEALEIGAVDFIAKPSVQSY
jgi:two-component system chemotaxis response regulator CheB